MKNTKKWVNIKFININYIESVKSKQWMDKNLGAKGKSGFIREAVAEKINLTKAQKALK